MRRRRGFANFLRSFAYPAQLVVCEEPKFIYFKTPKAAGTSILRKHLQPNLPVFFKKDHPEQLTRWLQRITDRQLEQYYVFTVIRNPWDRIVSVAGFFGIPVREFILNLPKYLEDPKIRSHSLPCHHSSHWKGEPFADAICRIECLQPDYNLVCDRLGIERHLLAFANKTQHAHYSAYYGDEERLIVERAYIEDIRLFGYVFERERRRPDLSLLEPPGSPGSVRNERRAA